MRQFEVLIEMRVPGTPEQTWEAITERGDAYLWPVTYEPRVGGAERGLSGGGGVVTAWEPARHFGTHAERPGDGWWNQLDYWLDQLDGDGGTWLRYHHRSVAPEAEHAATLDGCRQHTAFYLHSLAEYVRRFAGRRPQYVSVAVPGGAGQALAALGLDGMPAGYDTGEDVTMTGPSGTITGVVDFAAPSFLGIRTADAFVRVYGREPWGQPSDVALHLFDPAADAGAWRDRLERALTATTTMETA